MSRSFLSNRNEWHKCEVFGVSPLFWPRYAHFLPLARLRVISGGGGDEW